MSRFALFFALFVGGVAGAFALATSAFAHRSDEPMPAVLAEKLVDILVAGRHAQQFQTEISPDCTPEQCLAEIVSGITQKDMEWLDTAPEAELPSNRFGRLPASLTVRFFKDLHHGLSKPGTESRLNETEERLIEVFETWQD